MNELGLALSGGGFRASLYHLGLVRFLRDAGILSRVSQITSVSGGSIFAAHLMLNWGRYNGSPEEFAAAASELIAFVRLDVRNRILRRFPLTLPLRWLRRPLGLPTPGHSRWDHRWFRTLVLVCRPSFASSSSRAVERCGLSSLMRLGFCLVGLRGGAFWIFARLILLAQARR